MSALAFRAVAARVVRLSRGVHSKQEALIVETLKRKLSATHVEAQDISGSYGQPACASACVRVCVSVLVSLFVWSVCMCVCACVTIW